jgi:hypothetical protein
MKALVYAEALLHRLEAAAVSNPMALVILHLTVVGESGLTLTELADRSGLREQSITNTMSGRGLYESTGFSKGGKRYYRLTRVGKELAARLFSTGKEGA